MFRKGDFLLPVESVPLTAGTVGHTGVLWDAGPGGQSGYAAMLMVGSHKARVRRSCPGLPLGCRDEGQESWNSLAGGGTEKEITRWHSPSCLCSLGSFKLHITFPSKSVTGSVFWPFEHF